ncbi:hypothetical protein HYV83_05295 [Candidatus Woesearchaeota archaeon]|nr:hypothetical protein [Candidatus Woesearchaeota archaeon]
MEIVTSRNFDATRELIVTWDSDMKPLESLAADYEDYTVGAGYSLGTGHSQFSPGLVATNQQALSIRIDATGRVYNEISSQMAWLKHAQNRFFLNGQPNPHLTSIMVGRVPEGSATYLYAERGGCVGVGYVLNGSVEVKPDVPVLYVEKQLYTKEGGFWRKGVMLFPKGIRLISTF